MNVNVLSTRRGNGMYITRMGSADAEFRATWHEAEGAGSMRFSTNFRDPASYKHISYAQRERPFWLPEPIAHALLDEMDWPFWAVHGLAAACVALCILIVREVHECMRAWQRDKATRELLLAEQLAIVAAAAAKAAPPEPRCVEPSVEPPSDGRMRVRVCRYCDIEIADEYVDAHLSGKRHKKLEAAAGSLAAGRSCWLWRLAEAPRAAAPASAALQNSVHDIRVAPPSRVSQGGGDGGKGAWSVQQLARRRRT